MHHTHNDYNHCQLLMLCDMRMANETGHQNRNAEKCWCLSTSGYDRGA
jgi:hypothetical protein